MKTTLAKNPTAGWCRRLLCLTTGLILLSAAPFARAQQNLEVVIPIEKVRLHYNIPHEDGSGKSCGVELHGGFPVFKNHTNHADYSLINPGPERPDRDGFVPVAPGDTALFRIRAAGFTPLLIHVHSLASQFG